MTARARGDGPNTRIQDTGVRDGMGDEMMGPGARGDSSKGSVRCVFAEDANADEAGVP